MKHNLKKVLRRNSFINIYLFVIIPVFFLIVSECISFAVNHISHKNLLTQNYAYTLDTLHSENMSLLQNITSFVYSLSGNNDFMDYIYNNEPVPIEDLRLKNQVKLLSEQHQFIDGISIIKRNGDDFVSSDDKIYSIKEYFETIYKYEKYPTEYWQSYTAPIQGINFLAPTTVLSYDQEKYIYPVVYSKIGSKSLGQNLIVINIDMNKMAQYANQKLNDNTNILFINNDDNNLYDFRTNTITHANEDFTDKLHERTSNNFYCKMDGKRCYVISLYQKNSPFGYSYAITLPAFDLYKAHSVVLITSLLLLLASLFVAFLSSRKLFNPWKLLAANLNIPDSVSEDTDSSIETRILESIDNLILDKSSMSEQFENVLPLAQERYLIKILNSSDSYIPEENTLVNFKYEYFCSVIIKLRLTDEFSDLYTKNDYNNISNGIYNIIKAMFGETFDSFVIPSENDTLYILLNLPDDTQMDKIYELTHGFQNLIEPDKQYITLHAGIGNILHGLDGMKQSHNEAMNSISAIPGINTARPTEESEEKISNSSPMILNINDETAIYNNLIMGNVDKARQHILELFDKNSTALSEKRTMTQFYMQIYNVIFKAMKTKNVSYGEEGANDLDTLLNILSNTPLEIHETMLEMLSLLEASVPAPGSKTDVTKILEYINDHYTEDIYLEGLAESFAISPSYLSKLIKDNCGMNFVAYLASLRIEKAQNLLLESDLSITDIYIQSGFNNRTTFIRAFKKATGLSPSDFRKLNKA